MSSSSPPRRRLFGSRRRIGSIFLLTALAVVSALLPAGCRAPAPDATNAIDRPHRHRASGKPNVILIVLDTARGDRVSANGYGRLTTPYIDALARDAVNFRRAHSVAPWTLPSHMSMFTGLTPLRHGATWRAFSEPEHMDLKEVLAKSITPAQPDLILASRLRRAGFSTAGFSSNAWVARRTGFDTGFDAFYEMWRERRMLRNGYGWLPPQITTSREMDHGDAGEALMKFRQHVLAQGGALREPFFLFFNLIDPHYPYSPPELWRYGFSSDRVLGEQIARLEFSEMELVAGARPVDVARFSPFYDAEMSYVDFVVGRLLAWLRETGYYDETLIIVTSDHGEHLGEHGKFSHQFSVDEELLHIPLIVRFPKPVDAERGALVDDPLVSNLDVYQTIIAATDAPPARARAQEEPSVASSALESFDLRRWQPGTRKQLLAEYDYSLPYLRAHSEAHPAFDVERHRVRRWVVYEGDRRQAFVERDGRFALAGDDAAEPVEASLALLKLYSTTFRGDGVKSSGTADKEALERLKALGYVK